MWDKLDLHILLWLFFPLIPRGPIERSLIWFGLVFYIFTWSGGWSDCGCYCCGFCYSRLSLHKFFPTAVSVHVSSLSTFQRDWHTFAPHSRLFFCVHCHTVAVFLFAFVHILIGLTHVSLINCFSHIWLMHFHVRECGSTEWRDFLLQLARYVCISNAFHLDYVHIRGCSRDQLAFKVWMSCPWSIQIITLKCYANW